MSIVRLYIAPLIVLNMAAFVSLFIAVSRLSRVITCHNWGGVEYDYRCFDPMYHNSFYVLLVIPPLLALFIAACAIVGLHIIALDLETRKHV